MEDTNRVSDKELENICGGSGRQRFVRYCVVKGDTLNRIALRCKTTENEIMLYNPLIKEGSLRIGLVLLVPDNR